MRPRERRETGQNDLFKAGLDQIIDMAGEARRSVLGAFSKRASEPSTMTDLAAVAHEAGLAILKHA